HRNPTAGNRCVRPPDQLASFRQPGYDAKWREAGREVPLAARDPFPAFGQFSCDAVVFSFFSGIQLARNRKRLGSMGLSFQQKEGRPMFSFTRRFGLTAMVGLAALALAAPAVRAQAFVPIYPGGPTFGQYLNSIRALGQAYRSVPPYAMGFNPYAQG